jgi:hypothetical protein
VLPVLVRPQHAGQPLRRLGHVLAVHDLHVREDLVGKERVDFKDECPPTQADPVAKASRSAAAQRKAQTKRTTAGEPCHSLATLLSELATRARNTIRVPGTGASFEQLTEPTPTQARALELIESYPLNK